MQKFCVNCGTQLEDDIFICPNCGALPDSQSSLEPISAEQTQHTPVQPSIAPKKSGGFKWWMVALPTVLVIVAVLALSWQALLMMISPKTALGLAVGSTAQTLEKRYEGTPIGVLSSSELTEQRHVGLGADINYAGEAIKAKIQFDYIKEQRQTALQVSLSGPKEYSAGVYLDPEFVAASINFFDNGAYYGLNFDSFKEDIKKSFLADVLDDEQIDAIDKALDTLLDLYTKDPADQELLEPYRQVVKDFFKALEAQKGSAEALLDGKSYTCDTVTFLLTEKDVVELLQELVETLEEDDQLREMISYDAIGSEIGVDMDEYWSEMIDTMNEGLDELADIIDLDAEVICYVRNGRLVKMQMDVAMELDGEEMDVQLEMIYGLKAESDLIFELTARQGGEEASIKAVSHISKDASMCKETLTVTINTPYDEEIEIQLSTKWNKETHALTLAAKAKEDNETLEEIEFTCKLKELENGFEIIIDHESLKPLLELADMSIPEDLTFVVTLTCTAEAQITKPDYVNLDKWDETMLQQLQDAITKEFMGESVA